MEESIQTKGTKAYIEARSKRVDAVCDRLMANNVVAMTLMSDVLHEFTRVPSPTSTLKTLSVGSREAPARLEGRYAWFHEDETAKMEAGVLPQIHRAVSDDTLDDKDQTKVVDVDASQGSTRPVLAWKSDGTLERVRALIGPPDEADRYKRETYGPRWSTEVLVNTPYAYVTLETLLPQPSPTEMPKVDESKEPTRRDRDHIEVPWPSDDDVDLTGLMGLIMSGKTRDRNIQTGDFLESIGENSQMEDANTDDEMPDLEEIRVDLGQFQTGAHTLQDHTYSNVEVAEDVSLVAAEALATMLSISCGVSGVPSETPDNSK